MLEVVKKPLVRIKSGVTALLFYIMRGISMTLHSKAGRAFKLVMGDSIFVIGDKLKRGKIFFVTSEYIFFSYVYLMHIFNVVIF